MSTLTCKDTWLNLFHYGTENAVATFNAILPELIALEQNKKAVYRFPIDDKMSLAITISDPTDILTTRKQKNIVLDINAALSIVIDHASDEPTVPLMDKLYEILSDNSYSQLHLLKNLSIFKSQTLRKFPAREVPLTEIIVTGEIAHLTTEISIKNVQDVDLSKLLGKSGEKIVQDNFDIQKAVINESTSILTLQFNFSVTNHFSKFMN